MFQTVTCFKLWLKKVLRAVAPLVGVVEELVDDDAIFVDHVGAGVGNAVERAAAPLCLGVQDSEAPDDVGVDVRQELVGDVLQLRELGERLLIVVGNRVELDACGFKLRIRVAQLTELRPARRSPDHRAIEDNDGLRTGPIAVKRNRATERIGQREVGDHLVEGGLGAGLDGGIRLGSEG